MDIKKTVSDKADGKGRAAVEEVEPVPGNRLQGKVQTAFVSEKTVNIPVDP